MTPLKEAQRELNSLISDKIEGNLRFTKQKYYEHGNRASRLLAFHLKKTAFIKRNTKVKIKEFTYISYKAR